MMLQVGDIVKFFDYNACSAARAAANPLAEHADYWRIGIVAEIRDEPWDDDWDESCVPYAVVTHNGHSQPIGLPDNNNLGTWVEIISRA